MVAEKLPPHDIEAEEAVIASLLVDSEAIFKVAPILQPQDFFREKNGWAYEACLALWQRNEAINQVTVAHELARRERLEELGGVAYLSQLVADLPTAIGVEHYAQIVKRDKTYRDLVRVVGDLSRLAYEGGPDIEGVLLKAENMILSLRGGERLRDFIHIKEILDRYWEEVGAEGGVPSVLGGHVRTGFVELDTLLGGLKRSDFIVVAARPSFGKTSLVLNIARNAAKAQAAKVAVFSLEMAADQLAQRLLASESEVDSTRLRLGQHTEREEQRVMHALGVLGGLDIYVDDTPILSVMEMRGKAFRLQKEKGVDLVIVDHLQLIHGPERGRVSDNRVQEISFISRSLKELARELNAPVVACSQLSRAPEMRTPHIPMLSDLRESGSIEQDADVVAFIYREDVYVGRDQWQIQHPDSPSDAYPSGIAQVIVAKHRNGPTGTVHLRFRQRIAKFEDLLVRDEEAAYAPCADSTRS